MHTYCYVSGFPENFVYVLNRSSLKVISVQKQVDDDEVILSTLNLFTQLIKLLKVEMSNKC